MKNPQFYQDFMELWMGRNPTCYRGHILAYLAHCQTTEQDPGPQALREFLDDRRESGLAASTIRLDYYSIKKFLLEAHDYEASKGEVADAELSRYSLTIELQGIRLPVVDAGTRAQMVAAIRPEQMDRVINAASKRTGLMIEFLVNTGFRLDEMTSVRLRNVRQAGRDEKGRLWYTVKVLGKGRKERQVWVLGSLVTRIRRAFAGQEFLFETKTGNPLNNRDVRGYVTSTFLRVLGIPLSPHNLRHYHVGYLLDQGERLGAVSRAIGHASETLTARVYDPSRIKREAYIIRHYGAKGSKGGRRGGKSKNL